MFHLFAWGLNWNTYSSTATPEPKYLSDEDRDGAHMFVAVREFDRTTLGLERIMT